MLLYNLIIKASVDFIIDKQASFVVLHSLTKASPGIINEFANKILQKEIFTLIARNKNGSNIIEKVSQLN